MNADVGQAVDRLRHFFGFIGQAPSSSVRSGPKILTEFSPFTPESGFHHVVANILGKRPIDADQGPLKLAFHFIRQFVFGARSQAVQPGSASGLFLDHRPIFGQFQQDEKLDVVEARRIGAVVGPVWLR